MRAKINRGLLYKQFAQRSKAQTVVTLEPNQRSVEQGKEKGLPTHPIRLRLIRVDLNNGEFEVLITNLMDENAFPVSEFEGLYHLRWGVEENYKRLKQWVEIENFSGKSVLSIKHDFYAKVLTTNLTLMAANAAQLHVDKATAQRKHDDQVNFAQALSKMKNTLVELLALSVQERVYRLEKLFHYMARTTEPIRKGRSYRRLNAKSNNRFF